MSTRVAALVALTVIGVALIGSRFTLPKSKSQVGLSQKEYVVCHIQPIEYRFQDPDLILTGSVFAIVPNKNGSADILITPDKIYKGTVPTTGVVLAAQPAVAGGAVTLSRDLHFTSNDPPYFLVLSSRTDGRYDTSTCDGSRLLGDGLTAEELDVLGQ